jgi:hypothetical protein
MITDQQIKEKWIEVTHRHRHGDTISSIDMAIELVRWVEGQKRQEEALQSGEDWPLDPRRNGAVLEMNDYRLKPHKGEQLMGKTLCIKLSCGCELWEGLDAGGEVYPEMNYCEKHETGDAERVRILRERIEELEQAEYQYRSDHDVLGDGDIRTGHSWDHMRHSGDRARATLEEMK